MDTLTALMTRSSQGALTEPAPANSVLQQAFQAALRAPDHRLLRPWRFLVIEAKAREQLGEYFLQAGLAENPALSDVEQQRLLKMPLRAPMIVVAITSFKQDDKVPPVEQTLSTGAAVQNFLLAIHAQGFASMWRTGWVTEHKIIKNALSVTEHEQIAGFIYLGTPVNPPKQTVLLAVDEFVKTWQAP
ncbi:nitroreductase family protein [Agitococcus lubricus]|uniref:Putative NAD(P)H nitroreductase n=1 Tax=Agitococcus lubricus TaxID=1077255 RepID=A0A2T5IWV4_9GAMM|nr:nitroreductase [Agitococcus lubricus]PTQ88427.1 nitroreductase [Agitococcus lubricus]